MERPGWQPSPDGGSFIALVEPLLRRDDVHAPQAPVVAVRRVGVLLHLKRVVLDVINGGEDNPRMIFPHPSKDGLGPGEKKKGTTTKKRSDLQWR